jgi:hypothetical protein
MAAWKLPVIVAAIAVPIVGGFLLGGPAVGTALGAAAVATLLVIAVRQRPRGPIGTLPEDGRRHVLVVVTGAVEEPAAVRRVAGDARLQGSHVDVRVLAPARIGFLDRWASDVEGARQEAQRNLVATVAGLAKAGIDAEARVGDEDVVQAVEDQLHSFEADEVVLVSAESHGGEAAAQAADELRGRLRAEFRHINLGRG